MLCCSSVDSVVRFGLATWTGPSRFPVSASDTYVAFGGNARYVALVGVSQRETSVGRIDLTIIHHHSLNLVAIGTRHSGECPVVAEQTMRGESRWQRNQEQVWVLFPAVLSRPPWSSQRRRRERKRSSINGRA